MPTASVPDTLRVLSTVLAPVLAQGPIIRRPRVLALAERLDADRRAGRLLRRLRTRYGSGPLRLRVPGRSVVVLLSPEDVRTVLLGTPEPYTPADRCTGSARTSTTRSAPRPALSPASWTGRGSRRCGGGSSGASCSAPGRATTTSSPTC